MRRLLLLLLLIVRGGQKEASSSSSSSSSLFFSSDSRFWIGTCTRLLSERSSEGQLERKTCRRAWRKTRVRKSVGILSGGENHKQPPKLQGACTHEPASLPTPHGGDSFYYDKTPTTHLAPISAHVFFMDCVNFPPRE